MRQDGRENLEKIAEEALRKPPEERRSYLASVCADAEMRREAERLIAEKESHAATTGGEGAGAGGPGLAAGARVGAYEIVAPLGAGGMGVVYKARDTRLGRLVALKLLPEATTGDPTARARLLREAQNASALNHPNIATVYEAGESNGQIYIAMEFVEGRALTAAVPREGLAAESAMRYGAQIASALGHAHDRGIVHRDLKPANVMVTPEGQVKVLDFGLAKRVGASESPETPTEQSLTAAGVVVGTLAYMAPETLRGEPADARTDLWAEGAVLHEMLVGTPPFAGKTAYELTSAILREQPRALPEKVPASLRTVVQRCLAKEREHRYQHASEIRAALEAIGSDTQAGMPRERANRGRRRAAAAGGVALIAALALLAWGEREMFRAKLGPSRAASASEWVQLTDFADSAVSPALSPDGKMLTFIRGEDPFLGPGQIEAKVLPNGEPVQLTHDALDKMEPQFSPDGSAITYTGVPRALGSWDTWTVPILGGGEPRLMLPNAEGLTWIDAGHVMFSQILTGLHMAVMTSSVDRSGSREVYVPPRERGMAHKSALSPDHKWVLVAEMDNGGWLPCRVVPFDGSSKGRAVGPPDAACTYAAWSPDGAWMYLSSNKGGRFHLWRQKFPDGEPQELTSGATEEEGIAPAPDGNSVITSVGTTESTVWVEDARGERQISSEGFATSLEFSNDGKRIYYRILRNGAGRTFARQGGELWVTDLETGKSERLLGETLVTAYDVSAGGTQVVFASQDAGGRSNLWIASLKMQFPPRQIASSVEEDQPFWDEGGRIYFRAAEEKLNFVYRMNADGSDRTKIVANPILELHGVSPDGHWATVAEGPDVRVAAEPLQGGKEVAICPGYCYATWSSDGKTFAVFLDTMKGPESIHAAVRPGEELPELPAGGLTDANLKEVKNAKVFRGWLVPGPGGVSASLHEQVHRNLFRVPLQ